MIRITVELISANTGKISKLGEMHIANDGSGTGHHGSYDGRILRAPKFEAVTRIGHVHRHDRVSLTVWHLIAKMLKTMGYIA